MLHFNLAMVTMQQGKLNESLEHLDEANNNLKQINGDSIVICKLPKKTHSLNIAVNRALVLMKLRRFPEAIQ